MELIKRKIIQQISIWVCLLVLIGCAKINPSSSNQSSKWSNFTLHYNAIYNIDKLLARAEQDMVCNPSFIRSTCLLGVPNPIYFSEIDEIILKLQELLPRAEDTKLQEKLFSRLGRAYFLKADYYTANAYFDLLTDKSSMLELAILRVKSLNNLGKTEEALGFINTFNTVERARGKRGIWTALKAEVFLADEKLDSAQYYLQSATEMSAPSRYKFQWLFQLGKLNIAFNPTRAISYLRKVANSITAPSELKIEANLILAKLEISELELRIKKIVKILNEGYSLEKEFLIYTAIAEEYLNVKKIDSAEFYFDRLFNDKYASLSFKNTHYWQLAEYLIVHGQYAKAQSYIDSIVPESAILLDERSAILYEHHKEWISLLEASHDVVNENSEAYQASLQDLVFFYKEQQLHADAVLVLNRLLEITDYTKIDHLHELALLDSTAVTKMNNAYTQRLEQQERFYRLYYSVYYDYENEKYVDVIAHVNTLLQDKSLSETQKSKLAYLKTFSIGHINPLDSLLYAFDEITTKYPSNSVLKLVDKHNKYIKANEEELRSRKIAIEKSRRTNQSVILENSLKTISKTEKDSITFKVGSFIEYQLPKQESYYFAILIDNPRINLSPSRYAIGQFLRTRYRNTALGHKLILVGDSLQIMSVGIFDSLDEVEEFESNILTYLPEIIKVGEKKYTTFVIPKITLEKAKDKSQIYEYLEKYIIK